MLLLSIFRHKDKFLNCLSEENGSNLNLVLGKLRKLFKAYQMCNVYILEKGEIEHYYNQAQINYLNVSNKANAFKKERDYLLKEEDISKLKENYLELIKILEKAIPTANIDLIEHVKYKVIEWIQKVQLVFAKVKIKSKENLINNAEVEYDLYNQILEVIEFRYKDNQSFECKVRLKSSLVEEKVEFTFNETTTPKDFKLL